MHIVNSFDLDRNAYEVVRMKENFYDEQMKSPNPIRSWFHKMRHQTILQLVQKYPHDGTVVDLGCGNCIWNANKQFDVTGIDENEASLKYTKNLGRIQEGIVGDVVDILLPSNTYELVVISEVLEHIEDYPKALQEAVRILRSNGHLVVSVPYDTNLSFWRPLFAIQCLYQGYIENNDYYKLKCGHINHFSPKSIKQAMENAGLSVVEQFNIKRFTVFTVGRK